MAAFPICYKTPHKDQNLPTQSVIRQNDKRFMYDSDNMLRSTSISGQICRSCHPSNKVSIILTKSITKERNTHRCMVHGRGSLTKVCSPYSHLSFIRGCYSKRENLSTVWDSTESRPIEKQLSSLDSYFRKLQDNEKLNTLDSSNKVLQVHHRDSQSRIENELDSLDEYLGKLNNGVNQVSHVPTYVESRSEKNLAPKQYLSKENDRANFRKQNMYVDIQRIKGVHGPRSLPSDETSSLYLIGILASVNIAVLLFEIASPIRNADLELFSLPLLYGAKINHLIVVGEWWRLVTPMFLHAGIFHTALSCWALVSFGPQVCRGYGSFTFFLIYILGGISGNLTSFLHTPDPTVGGTGPVFAIIGAWLVYQIQNRDVIGNDTSENMFRKAIIITALGFILSTLGPIDEWTHFGAAFTGMAYGFLTSPSLQLDDTSSGTGQEEGLKLVRKYGGSCKSLIVFTIFIIVLSSFLFFMEPPLNALAYVNAVAANELEYMYIFG
ncbi:RHOMBOID-like protein 9, chloroplastic [Gastrolobium bilobum]|uniref:RHOMBOID-like protein 9, chloroplastic n=1 Tax=Gastrolobium bilobum TaxID=150636 RepID=UPI002AAF4866|nr:RHOMBOID-like protein 9, chloroplastic [Gastrolobium bilobum]XP_061364349.1 RHOMBOID-like protein 9, chloroplastic [Gastrolobium bilobum]